MKLDSLLNEYRDALPAAPAFDFEALLQREQARRRRNRIVSIGLLAAAASLAIWFGRRPVPVSIVTPPPLPVAAVGAPSVEPVVLPVAAPAPRRRKPHLPPKTEQPNSWSGFIALAQAEMLPEPVTLQVLRINISRDRLTALGLVQAQLEPNANVTAEVLLGEDGMARAIRIPSTE
ncbi:hypothetical protein [Bryobacter aggregatus]|uniref:hypothetical protein n=1 Tax=Bryobacter aggregatus TaxID=360054 RepID=UPI0004E2155F|nr:hypothetical protein [Bryobacter aggregatus]